MNANRPAGEDTACGEALSKLRHDIRNHLNTIKLSSALLRRRHGDPLSEESLRELDRSADAINELITRHIGEADDPGLLTCGEQETAER